MKSLTIVRHGKAEQGDGFPIDFDRPLAKRGKKDIARVITVLTALTPPVDWIVTSPARRARQTAELVADGLGLQRQMVTEDAIYESGCDAILALLERIPSEVQHAVLIGHNPTLEQLISGLCAGSPTRMINSLPTSGMANLELQIMWWEQVRWGSGLLRLYLRPHFMRKL